MGFGKILGFISLENIFSNISVILSSCSLFFSASSRLNTKYISSRFKYLSTTSYCFFSVAADIFSIPLASWLNPCVCDLVTFLFNCSATTISFFLRFFCIDLWWFIWFSSFSPDKLVLKSCSTFRGDNKSSSLADTAKSSCVSAKNLLKFFTSSIHFLETSHLILSVNFLH